MGTLNYVNFLNSKSNFKGLTFSCGQLFAIAYKDSSVINVPPIFRCCKELALDICGRKGVNLKMI